MATGVLISSTPIPCHQLASGQTSTRPSPPILDRRLFPDGLKTSGQHPAIPHAILPYSAFPKKIDGSNVWTAEEYREDPGRWTHYFTSEEVAELSKVADDFIASGRPLTGMAKVCIVIYEDVAGF